MKIYIINLKRSPERKKKIEAQIKQLNSSNDFIFFEAVDAKQQQHMAVWQTHQTKLAKLIRGHPLSAGETACFASHYSLWQLCATANEPIAIMEDDALPQPNFDDALKHIASTNYKYVRFKPINKKKQFELEPHFNITYQDVCGAQGYYLTPVAAKKLIARAQKWSKPVDDYLDSFWLHNIPNIIYRPDIIDFPTDNISTMDDRGVKIKFMPKMIRELLHGLLETRKFLFLQTHKLNSESKIFE